MGVLSKFIIRYKRLVVILFLAIALISAVMILGVSVNYNMVEYLPENAQSTKALELMGQEFTQAVPNARVMLRNVSLQEALDYKQKLSEIDGVSDLMWLDDIVDVKEPLEMADAATVESYYKNETALISLTIREGDEVAITDTIYELIGEENALAGDALDTATMQKMSSSETIKAVIILVPIIIGLLLISTSSWIEPVFYLGAIGVSVLINMGTNLFFGEVSFVTQSVSPILQLAVSLDYAIFLLHSFQDYRKQTPDVNEAMRLAIKKAFPTVAASAATTLFGFMALMFMDFGIGSDLGLNLVKGILLSFISVMVFLPALILLCYKWIDKTQHRQLLPKFKNIGKFTGKLKIPVVILVLLILVPSFLAQQKNDFTYGSSGLSPNSRTGYDTIAINEEFGESTAIVLLVPKGDIAREKLLCADLKALRFIDEAVSYATMVGTAIPNEFLDASVTSQFYSERYARIILYADTPSEGELAFSVVEAVQEMANKYYDEVHSCGQSVNLYDMRDTVQKDNTMVNMVAIIAIALVLLITFRSLSLPVLLLLTIETSIWINLSVPYFMGSTMAYVGYLVISTVQLGATVDYAILLTKHYIDNRKTMPKKQALLATLGGTFSSILLSAAVLSVAGFCLALTSSNPIVSQLGALLGRGTLLSFAMVVCFLPALLGMLDRVIEKTTYKAKFYHGKGNSTK